MRKLILTAAASGLLAAGALLLPAHADGPLPDASQCLPPAGSPAAPAGTASGTVMVIASNVTTPATHSCSYTFTSSTQPQYVAATPNAWTITATHTYQSPGTTDPLTKVTTYKCNSGDTPSGTQSSPFTCTHTDASASSSGLSPSSSQSDVTGSLNSTVLPNDTVTVTVTYACEPGDPTGLACGGIGTIAVGSPQ